MIGPTVTLVFLGGDVETQQHQQTKIIFYQTFISIKVIFVSKLLFFPEPVGLKPSFCKNHFPEKKQNCVQQIKYIFKLYLNSTLYWELNPGMFWSCLHTYSCEYPVFCWTNSLIKSNLLYNIFKGIFICILRSKVEYVGVIQIFWVSVELQSPRWYCVCTV